jgi:hypothetical protein
VTKVPAHGETARLSRLLLWPGFTGTEWQLPVDVPAGDRILVGWNVTPSPVDGEVPRPVAELLVTVLSRRATLTFASPIRSPTGARILPRTWRLNRHFRWQPAMSEADAVAGIFYSGAFAWDLQGQVVILSVPGAVLPLAENHLNLLREPYLFGDLARTGALGTLLPGVDGDVAGLYVFESSLAITVRQDLAAAAEARGAECVTAAGQVFRDMIRG